MYPNQDNRIYILYPRVPLMSLPCHLPAHPEVINIPISVLIDQFYLFFFFSFINGIITACRLLCEAFFTQHNVWEICPCFEHVVLFLLLFSIPLYEYTSVYLFCCRYVFGHVYLICINKATMDILLVDIMRSYLLGIARSQGRHMFSSGHNAKQLFFFQNDYINLQCHRQCRQLQFLHNLVK